MKGKKPSFDFKAGCEAMLRRFGATAGTHCDLMINTVAGPLQCTAYEDWLACAFDDVQAARARVGHGTLNPFSGKWNWMYDRPGPYELAHLHEQLARVAVPEGDVAAMLSRYAKELQALDSSCNINTRLTYMYRDADNYKVGAEVVFKGRYRLADDLAPMLLALDNSTGTPSFVPGQVGLKDLQDSFQGCESRWDPERDHPWHEVTGIEPVLDAQAEPTDSRSIFQFGRDVIRVCVAEGWSDTYLPPGYPAMKARQDRYEAEQSAQEAASAEPTRERQAG